MVVSSIISVFSVEKKKDGDGNEIEVSGQYDVDIVFRCVAEQTVRVDELTETIVLEAYLAHFSAQSFLVTIKLQN